MSVTRMHEMPEVFATLPVKRDYKWYELRLGEKPYAVAALAGVENDLELHLTVLSWGPQSRREMAKDMDWLKELGQRAGFQRIVGMKVDTPETYDTLWPKFTRLFGFTSHAVVQTAWVDL